MDKVKVIELGIDETDDGNGVYAMSLVEMPAIEVDFIALSKAPKKEVKFSVQKQDGVRMLYGPVLIPEQLIYRVDENTSIEYYVKYSADTVKKATHRYISRNMHHNVNVEHAVPVSNVVTVESWLQLDEQNDKSVALGFNTPAGTWYIGQRVTEPDLIEQIDAGTFKGFSLEGFFVPMSEQYVNEKVVEAMLEEMTNLLDGL